MARFTLVIHRPTGRALLAAAEPFDAARLEPIRQVLDDWIEGKFRVVVAAETEVILVEELDVDLEARVIHFAREPEPVEAGA